MLLLKAIRISDQLKALAIIILAVIANQILLWSASVIEGPPSDASVIFDLSCFHSIICTGMTASEAYSAFLAEILASGFLAGVWVLAGPGRLNRFLVLAVLWSLFFWFECIVMRRHGQSLADTFILNGMSVGTLKFGGLFVGFVLTLMISINMVSYMFYALFQDIRAYLARPAAVRRAAAAEDLLSS